MAVPAADVDDESIRAAVDRRSEEVPSYQRISRLEIWRRPLPKTTTLKVQRGRLREALLDGEHPGPEAPAPPTGSVSSNGALGGSATPDERWALAALARATRRRAELLKSSDRLQELGVDSLTHVELVAAIEGRFGCRIDDDTAGGLRRVDDVMALVRSLAESPGVAAGSLGARSAQRPAPPVS